MAGQIFADGKQVDIPAVLMNRDRRVAVQNQLLTASPEATIVAAKLNIPGPIKNNVKIQAFFTAELECFEARLLERGLTFLVKKEWLPALTGPERFYLIFAPGQAVKRTTTEFEEATAFRRLFDLDVLIRTNGQVHSLSRTEIGYPVRTCLICGRPAKECGRARTHTVNELQAKVAELINSANQQAQNQQLVKRLVTNGLRALTYEVVTWPKPGLVDPVEHAAHPDMDAYLFMDSSITLRTYLEQCAQAGINFTDNQPELLFNEIRRFGVAAERAMFAITKGVNTHKGAIFSLGILIAAYATTMVNQGSITDEKLRMTIRKMLQNLVKKDFTNLKQKPTLTAGEKEYLRYGVTGIRGEAMAAYPTVFEHGLPAFRQANGALNERILTTFVNLALHTEDTTLIKRAGTPTILKEKDQLFNELQKLGVNTLAGMKRLQEIQADYAKRHLSLGGTADLLIITIFLGLMEEK